VFAGAAREVVFSNREVVRRINEEFIPVALKAAFVNNPPRGIEGELYAEIGRSKPAPQGICTVNSNGKVLTWALSFDNDASILKFLDHVAARYKKGSDAQKFVTAERFMTFPGRRMSDVKDNGKRMRIPEQHASGDRCPAKPALEKGTLVGRIIGRPLDDNGKPINKTIRQEDYMEARYEVPVAYQEQLAVAAEQESGKRFRVPDAFARSLISPAFLGQLDVNPLGEVPGSRNDRRSWKFTGRVVDSAKSSVVRILIQGQSDVKGGQAPGRNPHGDGRLWDHRVALRWRGYADIKDHRVVKLVMLANGDERLRWGNERFNFLGKSDASHLMAGHEINLDCEVRYGLTAGPCPADEVVEGAAAKRFGSGPRPELRAKMQRFQAGMKRLHQSGGNASKIAPIMERFAPLARQGKFKEAEALLDKALKLLDSKNKQATGR